MTVAPVDMGESESICDVFHIAVLPASSMVSRALLALLDCTDRTKWYPSLLIEGHDLASEHERLADVARGLGVPVMRPRRPRGEVVRDRLRTFQDEWFYARNSEASIIHLHASAPLRWRNPAAWLKFVMPTRPIIRSVYRTGAAVGEVGRVEISGPGCTPGLSVPVESMSDAWAVSRIYEQALDACARRSSGNFTSS